MELPASLRQAIEEMLDGITLAELQRAADQLSRRYRSEVLDGRLHVSDALAAKAYLATRLPATYAAVRKCFAEIGAREANWRPKSLLDIGSGPGTALWAALQEWPEIEAAALLEASAAMREAGQRLARPLAVPRLSWRAERAEDLPAGMPPADLVTLCYVLDELAPGIRGRLVERLWALTARMLVILEPGTPAGWQRIMSARSLLIDAGAYIVAPCPHRAPCPLTAPDWCHFSRRVARSRLHRRAKGGEVPWEDEKFIYLVASRTSPQAAGMRVLAPPKAASGTVRLKICRPDGKLEGRLVTRRDGANFKAARRLEWGDLLEQPASASRSSGEDAYPS